MPTLNRIPPQLLAGLAAICLCLMTCQSDVIAGHCGCESRHEVFPPSAPSCNCNCSHGKKVNCFQKAMKRMSAGIDKLLSFGKSDCDELLCDDACDAAMFEELMLPPTLPSGDHQHAHDDHQHHADEHGDHQHHAGNQGAHQHSPATEQIQVPAPQPIPSNTPAKPIAPPIRLQEAPSKPEGGSLFDIDAEPLGGDSTRAPQYRPVRPSAYNEVELRPIHPPQVSRQSSRRVRNLR